MIELYAKGTTDFSSHGIALAAKQASVTYQDNGRYDMDLTMPYDSRITIDYGMILRCPVPAQSVAAITLGTVSYWEVAADNVPLYSKLPTIKKVSYSPWVGYTATEGVHVYSVGDKVSYLNKNYQCTYFDPASLTANVPPNNSAWWDEIPGTTGDAGKIAATLNTGDRIVKTGDFNSTYMKAADTAGHEGFIQISKCTDMSESDTRVVPAQYIKKQSFTITEITKSSDGKTLSLHGEHISYQLGRTMLGECNISRTTPATALMFIRGAMKEDYPGEIETNLSDELTITGDFSWKNAQSAILDPKSGFLQATNGKIIRNDYNVYIIQEGETAPKYRISYGTNLKAVKWDGNVGSIVTRVYPVAQSADGDTLLLPEEYIDTVRTVPFVRPEALKTGLKVGAKEKQEDGTEIVLDEDTVYARMREAAYNRFNIDECDKAVITLEIDWQHLPDTAEYAQYAALANAAPGEWVEVVSGPLGISQAIQMTGYTYDPILMRYTKGTFGKKKATATVASYDIQSGAVTGRAIASNSIGGDVIMAAAITAREIEANSITSDRIASKSIVTELLAAGAVTADEISAGSITAEKIAAYAITAGKIAAGAVTADAIGALVIQAGHIASSAITSDKISAGAITAGKISAGAVTTEKLDAGAVNADKIAAGAITAAKISTADLAAIQATLQIANIASAQIASADINYAHVKDLTAGTAIFDTSITEQGVADRLYINRLMITYGQMVEATIGDLVIGASDGYYYHVDVEWDDDGVPALVPTRVATPSAAEIAAGHTSDGQTIIGNVGTFAELSSEDFYAINSIIDRITAKRIDVDQLWARQAFINKLMAQDISSNTYIQATIGNWQSGSTITQTIDSLDSRISSLGYGTVYMQPSEPDHAHLVSGDIWVQTMSDGSWQEIYDDFSSWNEIYNNVSTWQVLGSVPIMWVWDGRRFQQMYDALLPITVETQIQQLADSITLRATKEEVDILTDDITVMQATITIQAQEIEQAVSTVNAKAASFVMWEDPRTAYDVTIGDIWVKRDLDGFNDSSSWQDVYDEFASWQALYAMHDTWGDMLGDRTYVWNGSAWVETSDRATEIYHRTLIDQTDSKVTILAEESATLGSEVYNLSSRVTVTAEQITQEVQRATSAEAGKIDKTTQYQTADAIVSEAVSQSTTSAAGLYLRKTTQYQTADAIVTSAVSQAASAAAGSYLAKTSTYQTAESIVTAAQTYTNGQLTSYSTTTQTSSMISQYVTNNAYKIQSGIAIEAAGVTISGGKYVNIQSSGSFSVTANNFGIRSDPNETYAIWAGASNASSAYFRVKPDGTVYLTKLVALGENGSETNVNLRTVGLWKLGYHTVKSHTDTSITLSNGDVVNFNTAASVDFDSESLWTSGTKTLTLTNGKTHDVTIPTPAAEDWSGTYIGSQLMAVTVLVGGKSLNGRVDASGAYTAGVNATVNGAVVGVNWGVASDGKSYDITPSVSGSFTKTGTTRNTGTGLYESGQAAAGLELSWDMPTLAVSRALASTTKSASITFGAEAAITYDSTTHKYTATADATVAGAGPISGTTDSVESGTEAYDAGAVAGAAAVDYYSESTWSGGSKTITLTNGKAKTVTIPDATSFSGTYVGSMLMAVTVMVGGKALNGTVDATSAYNAGWNACRQEMVNNLGAGNPYFNAGTYYGTLYVAPTGGAQAVNNCRAGQTSFTVPAAK